MIDESMPCSPRVPGRLCDSDEEEGEVHTSVLSPRSSLGASSVATSAASWSEPRSRGRRATDGDAITYEVQRSAASIPARNRFV